MTLSERIERAHRHAGLIVPALARAVGVSYSAAQQWVHGETEPRPKRWEAIAKATGVRYEWLASGAAPMVEDEQVPAAPIRGHRRHTQNTEPGPDIVARVPLISWVQAGEWSEMVDLFEPGQAEDRIPTTRRVGPRAFAVRVRGDSMVAPHGNSFPPGTILIVDPDFRTEHASMVIAKLNGDQEATFKRLAYDGSRRYLQPLNDRYNPTDVTDREDLMICGVVVQAVMDV